MTDFTEFDGELEALRAELRRKDRDLLLAARYGKGLLEDNGTLKHELESCRQKCSNLEADLRAQRVESQRLRVNSEKLAENHMSDLEQQLDTIKQELDNVRSNSTAAMEEQNRISDDLRAENTQLKADVQRASRVLQQPSICDQRLQLCEEEKQKLSMENGELQEKLVKLQDNGKNLSQEVSTLAHACDKLSDELENNCAAWEHEMVSKQEELTSRLRELQESQETIKKLQLQLDQQSVLMASNSTASRMSLFEELTLSHQSLTIPDDSSSDTSDNEETSVSSGNDSPLLTICRVASQSDRSSPAIHTPAWSEECECLRCQELEQKLSDKRKELKHVDEQLVLAASQKFKLQQQVEEWQSDMDLLVQKQVSSQLKKEGKAKKKKAQLKSKTVVDDDMDSNLAYHMIKNSWLF